MVTISNKYQIEQRYISFGKSRSGQKINKVLFAVAHETSNNTATADNHYTYFNKNTDSVSAHTFIDDKKILEIIPLWEKAWHVQYNKPTDNRLFGADANDAAIGVELCRPGDFNKAYDRYVWYFAYLCKKFDLNPEKHIVSHKTLDPERRDDPVNWLNAHGVTWSNFITHVKDYFNRWDEDQVQMVQVQMVQVQEGDSADGKLVRGEKGPNVQLLNQMLHTLTYTFKTDDLFDQYTEAALLAFQKDYGLPQDAVYTSAVGEVMLKVIAGQVGQAGQAGQENKISAQSVTPDPLPTKAPEMVRLGKLIDTTNPQLIRQLKEQGYIVLDTPKV